jgi:hypothetical protein
MSTKIENAKAIPIVLAPTKRLVSEKKIEEAYGIDRWMLQQDRFKHKGHPPGIPYYKINRAVRYDLDEVLSWLNSHRRGCRQEAV